MTTEGRKWAMNEHRRITMRSQDGIGQALLWAKAIFKLIDEEAAVIVAPPPSLERSVYIAVLKIKQRFGINY